MTAARVLLGFLLATLSVGGAVLWQSDLEFGLKVLLTAADIILWLSASLTLVINVFSLDDQGRIPYNSLAYKYFSLYYRQFGPDGKKVILMPDKIKTCPMYWLIVMGIFLSFAVLFIGSLLIYAFYNIISGYASGATDLFGFIKGMFLLAFMTMFFVSFYKSSFSVIRKKFWGICFVSTIVLMMVWIFGILIYSALVSGMTIWALLLKAGVMVGIGLIGFVAIVLLLSILCICVMFLFDQSKKTLFGQLVGTIYSKFCPVIPVEPAPEK